MTSEVELKMKNLKKTNELRQTKIKKELAKLKVFRVKCKQKLTVARLKTMKGFEHLTDELAEQTIRQLEVYAKIILSQMNRLSKDEKRINLMKNRKQ